ncbi:hypothetical protein [Streptomyces genisteinicus]|uniref:Uncharacterized protein n=1 Tax=Streptomyces genisteinicus TaxID=2768068 RepID=A0A7H0I2H0_9ACTN|nr:hypothetical protein [Streptomyces genisteinicus]QNP66986.1 hypothetical protein IAG43_31485 [Streptomyces genisteinicus]
MEQPGTSRLTEAVQELASQVVSALRSGDHFVAFRGVTGQAGDEDLALAATRVLGADAMLPALLPGRSAAPDDLAAFEKAVLGFPPAPDAAPTTRWSHWAMARTLTRLGGLAADPAGPPQPDAAWLGGAPWQYLTHQLAVLGALALPGSPSAVAAAAAERPLDVARGFVRAVRRRDWLQAAAAGRWLVLLDGVPDTLGLDAGLEFVGQMGGTDARVLMHLEAARLLREGEPR